MKRLAITSEDDIRKLIQTDVWMMQVLSAAETLHLPDWWIGAGFLRNKIWDAIEGRNSAPTRDVDLVYFNGQDIKPETDWAYDEKLKQDFPFAKWEVRNQARMHYVNNLAPFSSTADGISHWTETATCVAVKLQESELKFLFCHGTADLYCLIARPTPYIVGSELMQLFHDRLEHKKWQEKWPDLRIQIEQ
jgi:hypothetical protein